MLKHALTALILIAGIPVAYAADPAAPPEMNTDRPDQTESPYTVPPGWVQIESTLFGYSRSLGTGVRAEGFEWGSVNVKLGLTANTDLQLGFAPFLQARENGTTLHEGVGDVVARLKWNLWGNASGSTAGGLIPYVKIPTASAGLGNDEWEGGLIFPVTFNLGEGWGLGTMIIVGLSADDAGDYHLEPGASASLGRDLTDSVGCYWEFFAQHTGGDEWQLALDTGITWALSDNVQLDLGINWFFAGDRQLSPFIGISTRF